MLTDEDARRMATRQTYDRIRRDLETLIRDMEEGYQPPHTTVLELKRIVDFVIPKGT